MKHPELPVWADIEDGVIVFSPGDAYEEALKALAAPARDQYWMEVARRCATERLHQAVAGSLPLMTALGATGLGIRILRDDAYTLSKLPAGKGAALGALEFRQYYQGYLNGLSRP